METSTREIRNAVIDAENHGRCKRRRVGSVLTDIQGNVLSSGFNGPPMFMPSCFDEPCAAASLPPGHGDANTACLGVHAEIRALLEVKDKQKIHAMYGTKSPCIHCVLALLETSCQEIYFDIISNDTTPLELWEKAGRKWKWIGDTITRRIDRVTDVIPKYQKVIIPAPKSVKIEITSKCNFNCGFCSHRLNTKKYADMDFEFFKKITKDMRESGVEELGLFYIGESFLCNWLPDAVKYAKEIGFPYVFLTTNGSLATSERVYAVMEAGLDSLKFSLNNADPWQFRQVTGMAPSMFARIKENVQLAWLMREKNNFKTRIYASSIKYDGSQQDMMQKFVNEIKPFVDEHYWLPLLSFGSQATEKEIEMGLNPVVGNPGRLEMMRQALPCWAVFKEGHISHDGLLSACCFDNSNNWIMADLKEVSFMEGWNSKKFQELRRAHLNKDVHNTPCEACIHGGKNE